MKFCHMQHVGGDMYVGEGQGYSLECGVGVEVGGGTVGAAGAAAVLERLSHLAMHRWEASRDLDSRSRTLELAARAVLTRSNQSWRSLREYLSTSDCFLRRYLSLRRRVLVPLENCWDTWQRRWARSRFSWGVRVELLIQFLWVHICQPMSHSWRINRGSQAWPVFRDWRCW